MEYIRTRGYFFEKEEQEYFYLSDTAWMLLTNLTKEEIEYYFKTRASQGFNAVQFVLLPEFDGLKKPNMYGDVPLLKYDDGIEVNMKYFKFARWCVQKANEYGLTVGLFPTWGDKVNKRSGTGPEIFNEKNTYDYAKFVSDYFAKLDIIFFLGGDKNPETNKHFKVFNEFARGIRDGKSGQTLMSYHVKGGYCSNDFYNQEQWLDFSVYQSGHTKYTLSKSDRMKFDHFSPTSYMYAKKENEREIIKPFLNGEPAYENHPQMCVDEKGVWRPIRDPELIFFTDYDVRKDAYWSVFYGASGFTYGANDIWQFTSEKSSCYAPSLSMTSWKVALQLPGATQLQYLRKLLTKFKSFSREVAQDLLVNQEKSEADSQIVVCTDYRKYIMAYTPVEQKFSIDISKLPDTKLCYYWFDPKNGEESKRIAINKKEVLDVISPVGLDYVLIIEAKEVK